MSMNGPVVVNGIVNSYDREVCFDAPVAMDTALYVDSVNIRTLASLRTELMVRLGFAAMTGNPPPGMPELLNSFLQDAQEQLYTQYNVLRNERWWGWQTEPGRNIYDVPIDCTDALNFRKVTWAGVADNGGRAVRRWDDLAVLTAGLFVTPTESHSFDYEVTTPGTAGATEPTWPTVVGQTVADGTVAYTCRARAQETWRPLVCGINPELYTHARQQCRPTHYELREHLEVFPTPDVPYVIWLKGHLGVRRFSSDADTCTVDARLIFLWALANAKAHYAQPDAVRYDQQVDLMKRNLVAGSHATRRYIPGGDRGTVISRPRDV